MEEMKQTGTQWIGEIPISWDIIRTKHFSYMKGRIGWQGLTSDEFIDEGPYLVTGTDFDNGRVCWERSYHVSEKRYEEAPEIQLKVGDLLVTKDGTIGKLAYIDTLPGKASLNSHLLVMRPLQNKYINRFLFWMLSSSVFIEYYSLVSDGSTMDSLSQEKMGNFVFPTPPVWEQELIADYLDECCRRLDGIISDLVHQIETLKAYKKSLITETVTKGLDKSAAKRSSKIEWISELPAHWDEKRLYIVAYVRARLGWRGLTADEYVDEGYAFLSAFNIINDKLVLDEELLNYITQFRYDESPEIKLCNGDILLVKDGAGLGKCARIDDLPFEAAPNGSLAVITPNERLHYRYLHYFFVGDTFQQRINQIKNGMGVPHLPQGDLRKIVVPLPPIPEQIEICDYLDEKCAIIDPLICEKEAQLESMRNHRSSLIYEYVTGKKRVKEVR